MADKFLIELILVDKDKQLNKLLEAKTLKVNVNIGNLDSAEKKVKDLSRRIETDLSASVRKAFSSLEGLDPLKGMYSKIGAVQDRISKLSSQRKIEETSVNKLLNEQILLQQKLQGLLKVNGTAKSGKAREVKEVREELGLLDQQITKTRSLYAQMGYLRSMSADARREFLNQAKALEAINSAMERVIATSKKMPGTASSGTTFTPSKGGQTLTALQLRAISNVIQSRGSGDQALVRQLEAVRKQQITGTTRNPGFQIVNGRLTQSPPLTPAQRDQRLSLDAIKFLINTPPPPGVPANPLYGNTATLKAVKDGFDQLANLGNIQARQFTSRAQEHANRYRKLIELQKNLPLVIAANWASPNMSLSEINSGIAFAQQYIAAQNRSQNMAKIRAVQEFKADYTYNVKGLNTRNIKRTVTGLPLLSAQPQTFQAKAAARFEEKNETRIDALLARAANIRAVDPSFQLGPITNEVELQRAFTAITKREQGIKQINSLNQKVKKTFGPGAAQLTYNATPAQVQATIQSFPNYKYRRLEDQEKASNIYTGPISSEEEYFNRKTNYDATQKAVAAANRRVGVAGTERQRISKANRELDQLIPSEVADPAVIQKLVKKYGLANASQLDFRGAGATFNAKRLLNPETFIQLGFAGAFGGLPSLGAALIGGATKAGPGGAVFASTITQAVVAGFIDPIKEAILGLSEQFKEAGVAFNRSILGIAAVNQAGSQFVGPDGTPLPIGQQLNLQSARARQIQLASRSKLLPLGIAGQTEATFVQGIVSALSQRGFNATPEQIARISELTGGAIQAQRPGLLDNTQLLLRDIQDVFGGGAQAKRTILSQLIRPALGGVTSAKSTEDVVKALEKGGLEGFVEAAKGLDNPIVQLNKLAGALDLLKTNAGDKYLDAFTPALKRFLDALDPATESGKKINELAENLGTSFGEIAGGLTDFNKNLLGFASNFKDSVVPFTESLITFSKAAPQIAASLAPLIAILSVFGLGKLGVGKALGGLASGIGGLFSGGVASKLGPGLLATPGILSGAALSLGKFALGPGGFLAGTALTSIGPLYSALQDLVGAGEDTKLLAQQQKYAKAARERQNLQASLRQTPSSLAAGLLASAGLTEENQKNEEGLSLLPGTRKKFLGSQLTKLLTAGTIGPFPEEFDLERALAASKGKIVPTGAYTLIKEYGEQSLKQIESLKDLQLKGTPLGDIAIKELEAKAKKQEAENLGQQIDVLKAIKDSQLSPEQQKLNEQNIKKTKEKLEIDTQSQSRLSDIVDTLSKLVKDNKSLPRYTSLFKTDETQTIKDLAKKGIRFEGAGTENYIPIKTIIESFDKYSSALEAQKEIVKQSTASLEELTKAQQKSNGTQKEGIDEQIEYFQKLQKVSFLQASIIERNAKTAKEDFEDFRSTASLSGSTAASRLAIARSQSKGARRNTAASLANLADVEKALESASEEDKPKLFQNRSDILTVLNKSVAAVASSNAARINAAGGASEEAIRRLSKNAPEFLNRGELDLRREGILSKILEVQDLIKQGGTEEDINGLNQQLKEFAAQLNDINLQIFQATEQRFVEFNEKLKASSDAFTNLRKGLDNEYKTRINLVAAGSDARDRLQDFVLGARDRELDQIIGAAGVGEQYKKLTGGYLGNLPSETLAAIQNPEFAADLQRQQLEEQASKLGRDFASLPKTEAEQQEALRQEMEKNSNALYNLTEATNALREAYSKTNQNQIGRPFGGAGFNDFFNSTGNGFTGGFGGFGGAGGSGSAGGASGGASAGGGLGGSASGGGSGPTGFISGYKQFEYIQKNFQDALNKKDYAKARKMIGLIKIFKGMPSDVQSADRIAQQWEKSVKFAEESDKLDTDSSSSAPAPIPSDKQKTINSFQGEINRIPKGIRALLSAYNIPVYLAQKYSDLDPDEANTIPRGYEALSKKLGVPQTFEKVAGAAFNRDKKAAFLTTLRPDFGEVSRHELGHAFDIAVGVGKGPFSKNQMFINAYMARVKQLGKAPRGLEYFFPKAYGGLKDTPTEGLEETFAELFNSRYSASGGHFKDLIRFFPELNELQGNYLQGLEAYGNQKYPDKDLKIQYVPPGHPIIPSRKKRGAAVAPAPPLKNQRTATVLLVDAKFSKEAKASKEFGYDEVFPIKSAADLKNISSSLKKKYGDTKLDIYTLTHGNHGNLEGFSLGPEGSKKFIQYGKIEESLFEAGIGPEQCELTYGGCNSAFGYSNAQKHNILSPIAQKYAGVTNVSPVRNKYYPEQPAPGVLYKYGNFKFGHPEEFNVKGPNESEAQANLPSVSQMQDFKNIEIFRKTNPEKYAELVQKIASGKKLTEEDFALYLPQQVKVSVPSPTAPSQKSGVDLFAPIVGIGSTISGAFGGAISSASAYGKILSSQAGQALSSGQTKVSEFGKIANEGVGSAVRSGKYRIDRIATNTAHLAQDIQRTMGLKAEEATALASSLIKSAESGSKEGLAHIQTLAANGSKVANNLLSKIQPPSVNASDFSMQMPSMPSMQMPSMPSMQMPYFDVNAGLGPSERALANQAGMAERSFLSSTKTGMDNATLLARDIQQVIGMSSSKAQALAQDLLSGTAAKTKDGLMYLQVLAANGSGVAGSLLNSMPSIDVNNALEPSERVLAQQANSVEQGLIGFGTSAGQGLQGISSSVGSGLRNAGRLASDTQGLIGSQLGAIGSSFEKSAYAAMKRGSGMLSAAESSTYKALNRGSGMIATGADAIEKGLLKTKIPSLPKVQLPKIQIPKVQLATTPPKMAALGGGVSTGTGISSRKSSTNVAELITKTAKDYYNKHAMKFPGQNFIDPSKFFGFGGMDCESGSCKLATETQKALKGQLPEGWKFVSQRAGEIPGTGGAIHNRWVARGPNGEEVKLDPWGLLPEIGTGPDGILSTFGNLTGGWKDDPNQDITGKYDPKTIVGQAGQVMGAFNTGNAIGNAARMAGNALSAKKPSPTSTMDLGPNTMNPNAMPSSMDMITVSGGTGLAGLSKPEKSKPVEPKRGVPKWFKPTKPMPAEPIGRDDGPIPPGLDLTGYLPMPIRNAKYDKFHPYLKNDQSFGSYIADQALAVTSSTGSSIDEIGKNIQNIRPNWDLNKEIGGSSLKPIFDEPLFKKEEGKGEGGDETLTILKSIADKLDNIGNSGLEKQFTNSLKSEFS